MIAGLGATWKQNSDGSWVDCDLWSNVFNLSCWNPSNPQLAGPTASNPTALSNPLTDAALGVYTYGSGETISNVDYLSSFLNPSTLVWIGVIVGGVVLLKDVI